MLALPDNKWLRIPLPLPNKRPTPAPVDEVLDNSRAAVEAAAGSVSLPNLAGLPDGNSDVEIDGAKDRAAPTFLNR